MGTFQRLTPYTEHSVEIVGTRTNIGAYRGLCGEYKEITSSYVRIPYPSIITVRVSTTGVNGDIWNDVCLFLHKSHVQSFNRDLVFDIMIYVVQLHG